MKRERKAVVEFTEQDDAILTLEDTWSQKYSSKSDAIRQELGMTVLHYQIRLNELLDCPEAIYARPTTVARLRRLRESRLAERRGPLNRR